MKDVNAVLIEKEQVSALEKENISSTYVNITESELKSIRRYTNDTEYAGEINAEARKRNNGEEDEVNSDIRANYNNIKNCLSRNVLPEMCLQRGTSLYNLSKAIFSEEQEAEKFLRDYEELSDLEMDEKYKDYVFVYGQLVSTSKRIEIACDFSDYSDGCVLEIHIPSGTPGLEVWEFSEYPEEEVLLTSDLKMRFDSFKTINNTRKCIKVSVVRTDIS